jgi:hypothetical protein
MKGPQFTGNREREVTLHGPGSAWLDCEGQDAGDGNVLCTIQALEGGKREVVVPAEYFDPEGSRLKVRIVRPTVLGGVFAPDCPSQEVESSAFVVECPNAIGMTLAVAGLATPLASTVLNNGSSAAAAMNGLKPLWRHRAGSREPVPAIESGRN